MGKKKEKTRQGFFEMLFKTKKIAAAGLVFLIVILLVAAFADILAPQKMVDGKLKSERIMN